MTESLPVARLDSIARSHGRDAAREKAKLLSEIEQQKRISIADIASLHDTLEYMRAYPDDARLLARVRAVIRRLREWVEVAGAEESPRLVDQGVPGGINRYPYSYAVLQHLHRQHPGSVEVDWDELTDQTLLGSVTEMVFTAPENESAEYLSFPWEEWVERTASDPNGEGLGFLLRLFEHSELSELRQAGLFEIMGLPIRYRLLPELGRGEVELAPERIAFQSSDVPRERFPLEPAILEPLRVPRPLARARAEEVLDFCLRGLCARELEIHPLIYASPNDVLLFSFERGLQVVLAGVQAEHRAPLGASYFFLVLKNGAPMAYGPAAPLFGACELGINLFPQFRGGEIRYVYSQFMRVLHQVLGIELFYLTRYGMGEDNPDAIASGAFWFYRKLGFQAVNPAVEVLAQEEEARMRANPGHRSDRRTLHRLSHTEAVLDLSGGRRRPFEFGELGLEVSRAIATEHAGDRPRAVREWGKRARRDLGIRDFSRWSGDEKRALDAFAPILGVLGDVGSWSQRDKTLLIQVIRNKAARSEVAATRGLARHARLEQALRRIVEA